MKTRRKTILIVAAAAMVIAIATWCLWPTGGPYYNGKPIAYWFRQYYLVGEGNDADYTQDELDKVLHALGTNALPYLVKQALSTTKDTAFRTNFYELLERLPESWHPPPFVAYEDIRREAMEAISEINPNVEAILPLLKPALEGTNEFQWRGALAILADVEEDRERLIPYFVQALRHEDLEVQMNAIGWIQGLGADGRDAVPALAELLKTSTPKDTVFSETASALGNMGSNSAAAIPELKRKFATETNWQTRALLAETLCKIDSQQTEALNFLIESLKEWGVVLSDATANSGPANVVTPWSTPLAYPMSLRRGPQSYAAVEAAEHLRDIGTNAQGAILPLVECLRSTNFALVMAAAEALPAVGAPKESFLPTLEAKLKEGEEDDRLVIARIILWKADPANHAALSVVGGALTSRSTNQVMAIFIIRGMGRPPTEAIPVLRDALNSPNPMVSKTAGEILKQTNGLEFPK